MPASRLLLWTALLGTGFILGNAWRERPPSGPAPSPSALLAPPRPALPESTLAPALPPPPTTPPPPPALAAEAPPTISNLRRALANLDVREPDLTHHLLLALELDPAETAHFETHWHAFRESWQHLETAAVVNSRLEDGTYRLELVPFPREAAGLVAEFETALAAGLDPASRAAWRETNLAARLVTAADYETQLWEIHPRGNDLWEIVVEYRRDEGTEVRRRYLDNPALQREAAHLQPALNHYP